MLLISVDVICCCENSPEKASDASEETLAELSCISTTLHSYTRRLHISKMAMVLNPGLLDNFQQFWSQTNRMITSNFV